MRSLEGKCGINLDKNSVSVLPEILKLDGMLILSTRKAAADDMPKIETFFLKMSILLNIINIIGIGMQNAFR